MNLMMAGSDKHILTVAEILELNEEKLRYVRMAFGYVRDMDDAEDIFQDCILRILNARDSIFVSDLKAYFSASIRHSCLRKLKARSKSGTLTDPVMQAHIARLSSEAENPDPAAFDDVRKLIGNCRARLKDLTMDVFEAKRIEGMSYKEIAGIFGIRESRVNLEIRRALKIFREEFKDYLPFLTLLMYGLHIIH